MKRLIILLLLMLVELEAKDESPWLSKSFEFQPQITYSYGHFDDVDASLGPLSYVNNSQFLNLSLGYTHFEKTHIDLVFQTADTRSRSFGPEYFSITGKKLLLNDVNGQDFVTLTAGLTAIFPWEQSLHDVAVFHHSRFDTELFASIGKEFDCGPFWQFRTFLYGALGCGVQGSPWFHSSFGLEKNFCDQWRLYLFADYLKGCGEYALVSVDPFIGYRNIAYQILNCKIGIDYRLCTIGTLGLYYNESLYSKNSPLHYRLIGISLLFPFAL